MSKLAILQMADTPQVESSAAMLRAAGYDVTFCGSKLRDELKRAGCDTVLSPESMYQIGYDPFPADVRPAEPADVDRCDLFCEIKVLNLPKIAARWPRLDRRLCWWRVNGGMPEHTPHGGDERDCRWPVVGANLWYGEPEFDRRSVNYVFYPPYPRAAEYLKADRREAVVRGYGFPYCLCHGVQGWGYNAIVSECRDMGVRIYGQGSPDGHVPHAVVPRLAAESLCMVHLKGSDCPGWALYEAMLSGCPVVMPRLLPVRSHMLDLFEDGVTYLGVGPPLDGPGKGDPEHPRCVREIGAALERLRDPAENRRIGEAGRDRLLSLMWREDQDLPAFVGWLSKNFA